MIFLCYNNSMKRKIVSIIVTPPKYYKYPCVCTGILIFLWTSIMGSYFYISYIKVNRWCNYEKNFKFLFSYVDI